MSERSARARRPGPGRGPGEHAGHRVGRRRPRHGGGPRARSGSPRTRSPPHANCASPCAPRCWPTRAIRRTARSRPWTSCWPTAPLRVTVDAVDGSAACAAADDGPLLSRVAAAVAEALVDGTWPRLKACEAHDCHWAYYDRSPAGRGRWCSMSVCGAARRCARYRAKYVAPADAGGRCVQNEPTPVRPTEPRPNRRR